MCGVKYQNYCVVWVMEDKVTLLRMTIMWQMLFPFVSRLSGSAPLYNLNEELKVTKEGEEEETN